MGYSPQGHKDSEATEHETVKQTNKQTNMFFLREIMRSISIHSFIPEFNEIHECQLFPGIG